MNVHDHLKKRGSGFHLRGGYYKLTRPLRLGTRVSYTFEHGTHIDCSGTPWVFEAPDHDIWSFRIVGGIFHKFKIWMCQRGEPKPKDGDTISNVAIRDVILEDGGIGVKTRGMVSVTFDNVEWHRVRKPFIYEGHESGTFNGNAFRDCLMLRYGECAVRLTGKSGHKSPNVFDGHRWEGGGKLFHGTNYVSGLRIIGATTEFTEGIVIDGGGRCKSILIADNKFGPMKGDVITLGHEFGRAMIARNTMQVTDESAAVVSYWKGTSVVECVRNTLDGEQRTFPYPQYMQFFQNRGSGHMSVQACPGSGFIHGDQELAPVLVSR